jgi:hypothetical protein
MTTSTPTSTRETVPVDGTPFELVRLPVCWHEGHVQRAGDEVGRCYDHALGNLVSDIYLGDHHNDAGPVGLPILSDVEQKFAWTLRAPLRETDFPILWRQADAEYVAQQLDRACPGAFARPARPAKLGVPHVWIGPVEEWLRLVEPLLNRGVPQALLAGCKEYCEVSPRR